MTEETKKTEEKKAAPEVKEEKKEAPKEADVSVAKKKKKKIRRQVSKAQAHVKCTYNNTMISITDLSGGVLGWSSSGLLGFKGAKKATPYAATQVVNDIHEKVKKYGIKDLEVFVKGVGSGRESSIRSLSGKGFNLALIQDVTPVPHNGCRPKKPRRV